MLHSIKEKIILIFWVILAIIIFFSSLEEQVFLNPKLKTKIQVIFPEGWGFFTKSPRDSVLDIYKIKNKTLVKVSVKNNSKKNLYGFSRKARIIGYEGSVLTNLIPISEWKIENYINIEKMKMSKSYNLKTDLNHSYLNSGEYLFVLYEPIPYAWSNYNQINFQKVKFVKIVLNDL